MTIRTATGGDQFVGLFKREHDDDDNEPSLGEAWQMIGQQLGLAVEVRGPLSMRAQGNVNGRPVLAEIEGKQHGSEFLRGLADNRRNRVHQRWRTELRVATLNPHGYQGALTSAVDIRNPAWAPGNFDPAFCRVVWTEPPDLAGRILTASTHERLMSIVGDVRLEIHPREIRLAEESKTSLDGGFVAGTFIHQYPGPIRPWPDRALAGPHWWIALLCDLAVTIDA